MAFGNKLGVRIEHNLDPRDFFAPGWGDIVCEVPDGMVGQLAIPYTVIGQVTGQAAFEYGPVAIAMEEALASWTGTLEGVFPTRSGAASQEAPDQVYKGGQIVVCGHKLARPTVFIPVLPGTNCEYDSIRAFERAGAMPCTDDR